MPKSPSNQHDADLDRRLELEVSRRAAAAPQAASAQPPRKVVHFSHTPSPSKKRSAMKLATAPA
jgi:hypothetical protein